MNNHRGFVSYFGLPLVGAFVVVSGAIAGFPIADLGVTKTAGSPTVVDGGNVTYTVSVQNVGPAIATNVVVTDPLDFTATFVSASGTGWTCSELSGTVTCTRPSLGIVTAPPITIVVNVFNDGKGNSTCNSVTVASDNSDPVPSNNTDQVCVLVVSPGTCSSLQDLLQQVGDDDIASSSKLRLVTTVLWAIDASDRGLRSATLNRLSVFIAQVQAAKRQGAVDPATADAEISCAQSLRQQRIDALKNGD